MQVEDILKIKIKLKQFCELEIDSIYLNRPDQLEEISRDIEVPVHQIKVALMYMFYHCDNDFAYNTMQVRDGIYPVSFTYKDNDYNVKDFMQFTKNYGIKNANGNLRYIYQQFKDKISDATMLKLFELDRPMYDNDCQFVIIFDNFYDKDVVDAIKTHGYSTVCEGKLYWKVFKPNTDLPDANEYLTLATYQIKQQDKSLTNKEDNYMPPVDISQQILTIDELLSTIKEKVGIQTSSKEMNQLVNSIDSLLNKYSSFKDWEKLQKWDEMINEWEGIKLEYEDNN